MNHRPATYAATICIAAATVSIVITVGIAQQQPGGGPKGRRPFCEVISLATKASFNNEPGESLSLTVPPGRLIHLRYVSVRLNGTTAADKPETWLKLTMSGISQNKKVERLLYLTAVPSGAPYGGGQTFLASQPLDFELGEGDSIGIDMSRNALQNRTAVATLVGYTE